MASTVNASYAEPHAPTALPGLTNVDRRHVRHLRRRLEHLDRRVDSERRNDWDLAERAALRWVLARLTGTTAPTTAPEDLPAPVEAR